MLKVWGRRSSFNLQKVMWLVGELRLPHEHIPPGGDFGLNDTAKFLAMNPHGRVPVIDDDGIVVWESQTILRYLAAEIRAWSVLGGRSGRTLPGRALDGLVAGDLAAGFSDGSVSGASIAPSRRNGTCLRLPPRSGLARGISNCSTAFSPIARFCAAIR
jgi:hypothetical protein